MLSFGPGKLKGQELRSCHSCPNPPFPSLRHPSPSYLYLPSFSTSLVSTPTFSTSTSCVNCSLLIRVLRSAGAAAAVAFLLTFNTALLGVCRVPGDFRGISPNCFSPGPVKHDVHHHVETKGPPISTPAHRLYPQKYTAAKTEF